MIDRQHALSVTQQCQLLALARSSVYYAPQPIPAADLTLMRVRSEHDIYALLTPEQKAQVEKNGANFMRAPMSMGERGMRGGPAGPGNPQK